MDEQFMALALEEAQLAYAQGEVPVGAVLVKDGQVLALAHNEREATGDPTAHAEILALRRGAEKLGSWRLHGCTLYVTLEPCPMCAGAISMSQLDRLVFGTWDEKQGCCGSVYDLPQDPAFFHRVEVSGGLMEENCQELLQRFFKARRGVERVDK